MKILNDFFITDRYKNQQKVLQKTFIDIKSNKIIYCDKIMDLSETRIFSYSTSKDLPFLIDFCGLERSAFIQSKQKFDDNVLYVNYFPLKTIQKFIKEKFQNQLINNVSNTWAVIIKIVTKKTIRFNKKKFKKRRGRIFCQRRIRSIIYLGIFGIKYKLRVFYLYRYKKKSFIKTCQKKYHRNRVNLLINKLLRLIQKKNLKIKKS